MRARVLYSLYICAHRARERAAIGERVKVLKGSTEWLWKSWGFDEPMGLSELVI